MLFRKNISQLSDRELLEKYKQTGKNEYFGELYNRYIPLIYGVCLKYLRDTENAQDAVMQVFEQLVSKVTQYEILEFRTWLYSVVKNHCLQLLRKEQKEISTDFGNYFMESEDFMHLLEEEQDEDERLRALNHCLEKLPEHQRISITCFFMEEMSYADITEKTGFALPKVKSYIQNGKRNLYNCIRQRLT